MLKLKTLSIEVQAAVALMLIQLAQKFAAELPGAMAMTGTTADPKVFAIWALSAGYVAAIVLSSLRIRWGFIIGIILGIEIVLQPIIFHVISGIPKDPPYYIFFPILQGILVIYFCCLAYRVVKADMPKVATGA